MSPAKRGQTVKNRLLAALPAKEYRRLLPRLEPVTLAFGDVLHEPGDTIRHVYFPDDSIISLLSKVEMGRVIEVGMVGNEGMAGMPVFMGVPASLYRTLVQGAGTAVRMTAAALRKESGVEGPLRKLLHRYTHSLLAQVSQSAVCNRFHLVEERLARWLLMTHDRVTTDELQLRHEFLSDMLGVRREGVTVAAGLLQKRKLIRYTRGHITVLDRAGLEAAACECYRIIRAECAAA